MKLRCILFCLFWLLVLPALSIAAEGHTTDDGFFVVYSGDILGQLLPRHG